MAKTNTAIDAEDKQDGGDAPLIDLNEASIKKMLARAKKRGVITYDEINEALPQDQVSSDQVEDVMSTLNDMGEICRAAADSDYRNDRRYDQRRYNNRNYRQCDNGTGGTVIGAIAGGLAGHEIAGRGDRTLGVILGGAVGAIAGRAIDKGNDGCR